VRHRKTTVKLNRSADHRKALLRNLATSLAEHGELKTTTAKARALVSFYERLIARAKRSDEMNAIRLIKRVLYTESAQKNFIQQLKDLQGRQSGYLRVSKVGFRPGDVAELSQVQFVR